MSQLLVTTSPSPPPFLLTLLISHLPYSLPLLRRLQFTRFPGGITDHSRVIYVAARRTAGGPTDQDGPPERTSFAAAYVDFSRGLETESWIYSSLESRSGASFSSSSSSSSPPPSEAEVAEAGDQALALLREVRLVRDGYPGRGEDGRAGEGSTVLVGALSEGLRAVLATRGVVFPFCEMYDKWLFRTDELPDVDVKGKMEEGGLRWGKVRREDIALVLSRTKIPRKE